MRLQEIKDRTIHLIQYHVAPILFASLVFAAVMLTAMQFCPPEHLVREFLERHK